MSIPRDAAAIGRARSSLLRCGATLETALWDPGYRGRSQSLLVVYNPAGLKLKKKARLMQLVFYGWKRRRKRSIPADTRREHLNVGQSERIII